MQQPVFIDSIPLLHFFNLVGDGNNLLFSFVLDRFLKLISMNFWHKKTAIVVAITAFHEFNLLTLQKGTHLTTNLKIGYSKTDPTLYRAKHSEHTLCGSEYL